VNSDSMNYFSSLRNFLLEEEKPPEYGCVMLFADVPDWEKLTHRIVKPEDVYDPKEEPGEYGYENKPHITVIYGIHDKEILDKSTIYNIIQEIPEMKISVKEIGVFENSDKPYDVVKFDIEPTKSLLKFREKFLEFPNTQSFKEYHPHMTIAYVRRGEGKKYRRILKSPLKFKFTQGVYSDPNYRKSYFDLKKSKYDK